MIPPLYAANKLILMYESPKLVFHDTMRQFNLYGLEATSIVQKMYLGFRKATEDKVGKCADVGVARDADISK